MLQLIGPWEGQGHELDFRIYPLILTCVIRWIFYFFKGGVETHQRFSCDTAPLFGCPHTQPESGLKFTCIPSQGLKTPS